MKLKQEDIEKYGTETEKKILEKKKVPPMLARLKKKKGKKKVKEAQRQGHGFRGDDILFKVYINPARDTMKIVASQGTSDEEEMYSGPREQGIQELVKFVRNTDWF